MSGLFDNLSRYNPYMYFPRDQYNYNENNHPINVTEFQRYRHVSYKRVV